MRDAAHEWTDEQIEKLERRIRRIYEDAARELEETVYAYFENLKSRDAKQRAMLEEGKITEEEYKLWRIAQIGRGKRFAELRDKMAERYTAANKTAVAYINDQTPSIYSLNRNYMAYTIEQVHGNVGFTLLDESTVLRLIVDQPDLMPNYPKNLAVRRGIDLDWGKQQITASITSSILQGKNLGRMADDLQRRMKTMNRDSATHEVIPAIRKTGSYTIAPSIEDECRKLRAEAMQLNARTRSFKAAVAAMKDFNLSQIAMEAVGIPLIEDFTGIKTGYRPQIERTYSATEIAQELGVSANLVGKTANENGLKTEEYGVTVLDKAKYSDKQLPTFRYNERGRQRLKELLSHRLLA